MVSTDGTFASTAPTRVTHSDRAQRKHDQLRRSAEGRRKSVAWAKANGFSEHPEFAAATAEILKTHGKPVTAASVRSYLPIAYPFLSTCGAATG